MRAPFEDHRRRRVSRTVIDTLDTLGGAPLCQRFELTILFQEYQEYQLTLPRGMILFVDTLGDLTSAGGKPLALGPLGEMAVGAQAVTAHCRHGGRP
jgi:hypothetical protein